MGGWIASETFDHTSTLQFLEQLTGVTIPNITPWRRQTFGNMSSAFGGFTPGFGWPRLPDTNAALAKAVYDVNNLPAPVVPAAEQVLPVQTAGRYPRPRPAQ